MGGRRYLEFNGKKLCVADWAKELDVSYQVLLGRLQRGWTVERTLSTPLLSQGHPNFITFKGETLAENQWAKKLGINQSTINLRVKAGYSPEDILCECDFASNPECEIEGCVKHCYKDNDYCKNHYERFVKYGDPLARKGDFSLVYSPVWHSHQEILRRHRYDGIPMEQDWKDFYSFVADMGQKEKGLCLCMIDRSKGFVRGNCFWGTRSEFASKAVREYYKNKKSVDNT